MGMVDEISAIFMEEIRTRIAIGFLSQIDGELPSIELESVSDDTDDLPTVSDVGEFSIPIKGDFDVLRVLVMPRGYRNARILKRDGYLSPDNAEWE